MKIYKIGTRSSPLALYQANEVKRLLSLQNINSEIIPINSTGDINLIQPLYEMNITGVFTKELDIALLNNQIDIAVHSLKDVPTLLPKGLFISSYLERDFPEDVLVRNPNSIKNGFDDLMILTGSLRRQAFWKSEFKKVNFGEIRGNVQTRLKKLAESDADATIFSLAGIKRMNLNVDYEVIDFMIPAPSQGVICCMSRQNDAELSELLKTINHFQTQECVTIERTFLSILEGGCSAPIGSFVKIIDEIVHFQGQICSLDGTKKILIDESIKKEDFLVEKMTQKILKNGGIEILNEIKKKKK